MESPALSSKSQISPTTPRHHTPPPRNSMEDEDASVKRKRPRLDSGGQRAHESMTSDHFSPVEQASKTTASINDNENKMSQDNDTTFNPPHTPPQSLSTSVGRTDAPHTGASSKVTLNLRDSAAASSASSPSKQQTQSSTSVAAAAIIAANTVNAGADEATIASSGDNAASASTSSVPIYTPPSPPSGDDTLAGSPRVDITEPEDIDDPPEQSVWHYAGAFNPTAWSEYTINSFPFFGPIPTDSAGYDAAFIDYWHHLTSGTANMTQTMNATTEWVTAYLENSSSAQDHWYELTNTDHIFLRHFSKVFRSLHRDEFLLVLERACAQEGFDGKPLLDFLAAQMALTVRMVQVDHMTLIKTRDAKTPSNVNLFSGFWLQALSTTYGNRKLQNAIDQLDYDHTDEHPVERLQQAIVSEPAFLNAAASAWAAALDHNKTDSVQQELLVQLLAAIGSVTGFWLDTNFGSDGPLKALSLHAAEMFSVISAKLEFAIKKQLTIANSDILNKFLIICAKAMQDAITVDFSLAANMLDGPVFEAFEAVDDELKPVFASTAWRFIFLDKCLRQGRMEIRITGLEALSKLLVDSFREYFSPNEPINPLVQWASRKIIDTKLVEYILSADSHPQLVSRSNNVIGFLAASHTFTNALTDAIWDRVCSIEDPRMFESIVGSLNTTFGLLAPEALHYFCSKFLELPVSRLDHRFRHCLLLLLNNIQKCNPAEDLLEPLPFRILLRFLRKACTDASVTNERRLEIWRFAAEHVRRLMLAKWSLEQRMEIYTECLEDFALQDGGASGTCLVLHRLLDYYGNADFQTLVRSAKMAQYLATEFCRLREIQKATGVSLENFNDSVKERLWMLQKLLVVAPEEISALCGTELWSNMVGVNAVGKQARNDAWESLAYLASTCTTANAFLEQGISEFLPTLDPQYHSRSLLNFAHRLWEYQNRVATISEPDASTATNKMTNESREFLFWQIALTTPDEQLASGASRFLVDRVIQESRPAPGASLSEGQQNLIDKTISQLADSCAKRIDVSTNLSAAAAAEQDPAAYEELNLLNTRSRRAFIMLKQLGQGLRALEQQVAVSERSSSQTSDQTVSGDKVEIKYQIHERGNAPAIKTLELSDQATVADLVERIQAKIGPGNFSLISGGQRVDIKESASQSVLEAKIGLHGLVIVHKHPSSEPSATVATPTKLMPLETEILKHFKKLYELLSVKTEPVLSQAILDFLVTFPPHPDVISLVTDKSRPAGSALWLHEPLKLAYSLYTMRVVLHRQLEGGVIDGDFMVLSVCSIVKTIDAIAFTNQSLDAAPKLACAHLIRTLIIFLKEPVQPSVSERYFETPNNFVDMIYRLFTVVDDPLSHHQLPQNCYPVVLEAARLNSDIWQCFTNHIGTAAFFKQLLLACQQFEGRVFVQKQTRSILAGLADVEQPVDFDAKEEPRKIASRSVLKQSEFRLFLWKTLTSIMSESALSEYASNSTQFFELMSEVFKDIDPASMGVAFLQQNLDNWLELLVQYEHYEIVGQDIADQFVKGISSLILHCLQHFSKGTEPQVKDGTVRLLVTRFLFPPIQPAERRSSPVATAPILNSETRSLLYNIVLRLCNDTKRLTNCVEDLIDALLQVSDNTTSWIHDRSKMIRSPAGYPGMVNLANTCYLNSLMTQLFMNLRFRKFILSLQLHDASRQRLLFALRQLFADLQDSWGKAALTEDLAAAIETYDGPLDPTIQMDADEAFNLIFDRIEGQLSSESDKQRFKTLFGGQIVQQIKSRECEHISERLEPITAVQCEVQGKSSLEDSLKSYIEGETMEGDNKYKCGACDRYVNAVKRACLRDIPDNLIFHLKRFDFDLVAGTRNKVNDYFSFPERIDMTPYTDKFLQNPEEPSEPDMFVLTGILVHSGAAELGHYYSFIREKPTSLGTWVEFNDSDVSSYDVRQMQDHCFGGDTRDQYNGNYFQKMYSAYMLFYQRESSISLDENATEQQSVLQPVKAEIPKDMALQLAYRNELTARTYCLFDHAHTNFLKNLFAKVNDPQDNACEDEEQRLKSAYLECLWEHVFYIQGRDYQRYGCEDLIRIIGHITLSCIECCKTSLDWLRGGDDDRLRMLLARLPDTKIRILVGAVLTDGLRKLKGEDSSSYGSTSLDITMTEDGENETFEAPVNRFRLIMTRLKNIQGILFAHPRAWVDFYDLLAKFAHFGPEERQLMIHQKFLSHAMELLLIENDHDWETVYPEHTPYIKTLEKRQFNLSGLTRLIGVMLPLTNADAEQQLQQPGGRDSTRAQSVHLYEQERRAITWKIKPSDGDADVPWFVDRFAQFDEGTLTEYRPLRDVVRFLIQADADLELMIFFMNLVNYGVDKSPAWLAEPYLHITLAMLEASNDDDVIDSLLTKLMNSVKSIGSQGGVEHLRFFKTAAKIRNRLAFPDRPDHIKLVLIQASHNWSFNLLTYPKDGVAALTREYLEDLLFPSEIEDEQEVDCKSSALDTYFTRCVRTLSGFIHKTESIGDNYAEMINFVENSEPHVYQNMDEETRNAKRDQVYELINTLRDAINLIDNGSNPNADSDELTDASSNYEYTGQ